MMQRREAFPSLVERFKAYVQIDTQADAASDTRPSTVGQHDLLDLLVRELKQLGLADVEKTDYAAVMATLPANLPDDHPRPAEIPVIGFIAHVDTYQGTKGAGVRPSIFRNYDGSRIVLREGVVLDPEVDQGLRQLVGDDIVHTDGTTLLGADDKAGVAEIMHALTLLATDPAIHHGPIRVAFTVDEEIARGTDHFDIQHFGAAFAYTMDGSGLGEIENETFCADTATILIDGYDVHPGYAKDKMVNAARVAAFVVSLFPPDALPETTEDRQGYLHPYEIEGNVTRARVSCLVRDFEAAGLQKLEETLEEICAKARKRFPGSKIEIKIDASYRNMKYELDKHPEVLTLAREAMQSLGLEPVTRSIRGGTDGSRLSLAGLPTPNLFAGGQNFHSVKEYVSVQTMEKASRLIVAIARLCQEKVARGQL